MDDTAHRQVLDSVPDGVFTIDLDWRITSFNRAAEQITGISRQEALGQRCCEVFRASICESSCALRQTLASHRPVANRVVYIVNAAGERIPISISTAPLKDAQGRIIGGVESFRDLRVIEELRLQAEQQVSFSDIIGRSAPMRQLFEMLPVVAGSDSTVLLEGASGTGKELFALAEGGTLFLDEIGDISSAMQMRLLRVLQERVYEPLGCVQPVPANVRVVAATHQSLAQLVRQGRFREDLFYRIHVVRLELPRLRDRREDIPLLTEHFIARFNRLQGRDIAGYSDATLARLMAHEFPGNIRELANLIEYAFILCPGGLIELHHLPPPLRPESTPPESDLPPGLTLAAMERTVLRDALRRHHGNRAAAARDLGIHVSTLFRKLKSNPIETVPRDR